MRILFTIIFFFGMVGDLYAFDWNWRAIVPDVVEGLVEPYEPPMLENCHREEVRSANPNDPVLNSESCARTICDGNPWGKSCTDICCSGETRMIGEGDHQQIYEVCQARSCSRPHSEDPWREIMRPLFNSSSSTSLLQDQLDEFQISNILSNALIPEVMADDPPSEEGTPLSPTDRELIAQRIESGIQSMLRAFSEDNREFIGEPASEYRSYFFYTLQSAMLTLHFLIPGRHPCPQELTDLCALVGNMNPVWGHPEGNYGLSMGIRNITLERDLYVSGYGTFFAAVLVHEVAHVINKGTGRLGYYNTQSSDGAFSAALYPYGEGWQFYHDETSARACGNIFYVFLPDEYRSQMALQLRAIGDALFGGGWMALKEDPRLARRYLPCAYYFTAAFQIDSTSGEQLQIAIGAYDSVTEGTARWYVSDYDEERICRYMFPRWGEMQVAFYENRFQRAGGVFLLWPACQEYAGALVGDEIVETCFSGASLIQPDLNHGELDSPDVEGCGWEEGAVEEECREESPPPGDGEEEPVPESEDRVGSSEGEERFLAGCFHHLGEGSAGPDARTLEDCSAECFDHVADGYDGEHGYCTQITASRCSQASPPEECTDRATHQADRCVESEGEEDFCITLCEDNHRPEYCGWICRRDEEHHFCQLRCTEHPEYIYCDDICRRDSTLSFCPENCRLVDHTEDFCSTSCVRDRSFAHCSSRCTDNPNRPYCPGICADLGGEPAFCEDVCLFDMTYYYEDWCDQWVRREISDEDEEGGSESSGSEREEEEHDYECPGSWDHRSLVIIAPADVAVGNPNYQEAMDAMRRSSCYPYVGSADCCVISSSVTYCFPDGLNQACEWGGYCGCMSVYGDVSTYGYCSFPNALPLDYYCCHFNWGSCGCRIAIVDLGCSVGPTEVMP